MRYAASEPAQVPSMPWPAQGSMLRRNSVRGEDVFVVIAFQTLTPSVGNPSLSLPPPRSRRVAIGGGDDEEGSECVCV